MYRHVVVIPAECDQIVGIGLPPVRPGKDMMDFEPVSAGTAFHGATSIPMEDMTSQFPVTVLDLRPKSSGLPFSPIPTKSTFP